MAKRICYTCKKQYSYCPKCGADRYKPTWMFLFHEENCKKIFDTLQRFSIGEYDAEQALKILDTCDLSHKDEFNPDVLKDLDDLLAKRQIKIVNNNDEI